MSTEALTNTFQANVMPKPLSREGEPFSDEENDYLFRKYLLQGAQGLEIHLGRSAATIQLQYEELKYKPNRDRGIAKDAVPGASIKSDQVSTVSFTGGSKGGRKPAWTQEENDYLLKNYETDGGTAVTEFLNANNPNNLRSVNAVIQQYRKLKSGSAGPTAEARTQKANKDIIARTGVIGKPGYFWSNEEDIYLLKFYDTRGAGAVADKLKRTPMAVSARKSHLKQKGITLAHYVIPGDSDKTITSAQGTTEATLRNDVEKVDSGGDNNDELDIEILPAVRIDNSSESNLQILLAIIKQTGTPSALEYDPVTGRMLINW